MARVKDLHRGWLKDPKYKAEYDALGKEFQLARTLIEARTRAGLSQTQLARRMKTSQSYIARIVDSFTIRVDLRRNAFPCVGYNTSHQDTA